MLPQWILKSSSYKRLDAQHSAEGDDDEGSLFLDKEQVVGASRKVSDPWRVMSLFSWTLTVVFALVYLREKISSAGGSYEQGWPTDFGTSYTIFPAPHLPSVVLGLLKTDRFV